MPADPVAAALRPFEVCFQFPQDENLPGVPVLPTCRKPPASARHAPCYCDIRRAKARGEAKA